ncbi:hypothetical protein E4U42_003997 [Claviceps africana]|uniref:Uncharacterized protein n=1 Tax=Claviceps africana TaxID=83212 RepID=A0A8K0NHC7_9HYPO|nr:hypothetical protein E4U42_003997 [Claviceps africana]
MCFAIRSCRCGHLIHTTERVRCVGVPWRKWDPAKDACLGVHTFESRRPPLDQLCPACRGDGRDGDGTGYDGREHGNGQDEAVHDDDHDDEHGPQARHPRRKPRAYTEPIGESDRRRHGLYALQRQDSHGSTRQDHVPALSRNSQSTGTASSVTSTRSSADFATCVAADEDPSVRVVSSSSSTSPPDWTAVDAATPPAAYGCEDPLSSASAALPSLSLHGGLHGHSDRHRPSTSPGAASSPALDGEHRHRFARLWGRKQTRPSQHTRHKSEPKDMRPEKKTRNRWKAIVSRNKSVDSDKSFVCTTAREMQNQERSEGGAAFRGE